MNSSMEGEGFFSWAKLKDELSSWLLLFMFGALSGWGVRSLMDEYHLEFTLIVLIFLAFSGVAALVFLEIAGRDRVVPHYKRVLGAIIVSRFILIWLVAAITEVILFENWIFPLGLCLFALWLIGILINESAKKVLETSQKAIAKVRESNRKLKPNGIQFMLKKRLSDWATIYSLPDCSSIRAFLLISFVVGLTIVSGCTIMGYLDGSWFGALAALFVTFCVVCWCSGIIFAVLRMLISWGNIISKRGSHKYRIKDFAMPSVQELFNIGMIALFAHQGYWGINWFASVAAKELAVEVSKKSLYHQFSDISLFGLAHGSFIAMDARPVRWVLRPEVLNANQDAIDLCDYLGGGPVDEEGLVGALPESGISSRTIAIARGLALATKSSIHEFEASRAFLPARAWMAFFGDD